MQSKRKMFLIFSSAMCMSLIVAAFVYYWINDRLPDKFNLSVKTPQTAPTPTDNLNQDDEGAGTTAKVVSPDENVPQSNTAANTPTTDNTVADNTAGNVIPVEPHTLPMEPNPKMPNDADQQSDTPMTPDGNNAPDSGGTPQPSLHTVYLDGFSSEEAAQEAVTELQGRKLPVSPMVRMHNGEYIVQFGVYSDKGNAQAMAQQLRNQNVYVKVE